VFALVDKTFLVDVLLRLHHAAGRATSAALQ
jgi:hypothetical protein